jgi:hypothetical protein
MTFISASDRDLMKRLTFVLGFLFVFTAAFSHLLNVYSRKFFDRTAPARWIWAQHSMSANTPVAFFAAREITLPENRVYTRLKILGDPEYTLFVNGKEIAGRAIAEERAFDLYDLSGIVKTGRNRIVVAVRAPQGAGGFLASIDLAPEKQNWVVTDGAWKIYRRWDPLLLEYDVTGLWERPMIIGEPPVGRWNYLEIVTREAIAKPLQMQTPRSRFELKALRPVIRTVSGIAVATNEQANATAFDFDFTKGRVRVSVERNLHFSRAVQLRFANAREELAMSERNLRTVVFAPGEQEVTTSETHSFRYVMAFAKDVRVAVVK